MNDFHPSPALPLQPRLIGGAPVRTRSQTSGNAQARKTMEAMAKFAGSKQSKPGRAVSSRTQAALHRFAQAWGTTVASVENLSEHIKNMRRGGHSREVQALLRDQRKQNTKLAALNRWFGKHIKPRMKKGGQAFKSAFNTAIASSRDFLGAMMAYLPSFSFKSFYNKLTSFFRGGTPKVSHTQHAMEQALRRSGRNRTPTRRYNPSTGL